MKTRNDILTIGVSLLAAAMTAEAQEIPETLTLKEIPVTMDSCMKYAVENSLEIQKSLWTEEAAIASRRSAADGFMPSLNASVSGQYSWGRNIDPETNTYNTVTTFNNYYQVYTSLTLFDGGRTLNGYRKALIESRSATDQVQKTKEDKAIEVMQKYVDAVYAKACLSLAIEKAEDSRKLLAKALREEELGIKSAPDVAQIRSQNAEDEYNLTHQDNEVKTAMLALQSAMNLPSGSTIVLDTAIIGTVPEYRMEQTESIYSFASTNSMEAKTASYNTASYKMQWKQYRGNFMPTLSLSAGVSTSYYRNLTTGGIMTPFGSQLKNNIGEWAGLTLSIPIFNWSDYGSARAQRASYHAAMIEEEQTLRKLHDDIEQAVLDCNGYVSEVQQMTEKVASDSLAYSLARKKYVEGMLSTYDLRTSASTLLQSRVTLLQKRLLYILKDRLVDYYKGYPLIREEKRTSIESR